MKIFRPLNASGSVLLAVLGSLLMLTVFLLALTRQISAELTFGRWAMDRTMTRYFANAGIERVLYALEDDKFKTYDALNKDWANDPNAFSNPSVGEGSFEIACNDEQGYDDAVAGFRYGPCDEAARININKATEPVLKAFFQALEIEEKEATALAEAVIDWRDADNNTMLEGAESSHYKGLAKPYLPRNANFESVEELQLVKGISPEIYKKVLPYVTVYTEDGKVNFNTAPAIVLEAFGLKKETAEKVVSLRKGADQISGTEDDVVFQYVDGITPAISASGQFAPEEFAALSNAIGQNLVTVKSDFFRIYSKGYYRGDKSNRQTRITCVMRRDGTIFYWKEE